MIVGAFLRPGYLPTAHHKNRAGTAPGGITYQLSSTEVFSSISYSSPMERVGS
jgi:hypothetical protein